MFNFRSRRTLREERETKERERGKREKVHAYKRELKLPFGIYSHKDLELGQTQARNV